LSRPLSLTRAGPKDLAVRQNAAHRKEVSRDGLYRGKLKRL